MLSDKGSDKAKTAKEEARELLLTEEASVREKVREIQKSLSLMLRALGVMAVANPIFAHSQLPSLVHALFILSPFVSLLKIHKEFFTQLLIFVRFFISVFQVSFL